MTLPNEHERFPVTNPPKMEIYKLTDKKIQNNGFKLAQQATKNTDKQLNKIRKIIHEQNWKLNKEIEVIKRIEQILDLKNTINEI